MTSMLARLGETLSNIVRPKDPKDAYAKHSILITWAGHAEMNPHGSVCKPTALPSRHDGCGAGHHSAKLSLNARGNR